MVSPFSIPTSLIKKFQDGVDAMIDKLGKNCQVRYHGKVEDCPNCIFDPIGNKSSNRHQAGGPIAFPRGTVCPMCMGSGKRIFTQTEVIKMIVEWNPRDFQRFNINVDSPDAVAKTTTYARYTDELERAEEIIIDSDKAGIRPYKCKRLREPQLTGLKESRYVIAYWQRTG